MPDKPSVCIVDFCGRNSADHSHISFWADWYPDEKIVRFGGAWWGIPDMPWKAKRAPSDKTVTAWANKKKNTDAMAARTRECQLTGQPLAQEFRNTFGRFLSEFWDKLFGFDIIKFDRFIRPPDGTSCKEAVETKYGKRAVEIILELNGELPILKQLEKLTGTKQPT